MSKLKPCPFCGGEAEWNSAGESDFSYLVNGYASIRCFDCEAEIEPVWTKRGDYSKEEAERCEREAVKKWNQRTESEAEKSSSNTIAQRNEFLELLYDIQQMCIGEIAMGYKIDAENLGEYISSKTGMTVPELESFLSKIKEQSNDQD